MDLGQPVIAVRIKDGIFVGNVTAAHDEDFLVMNHIKGIINCAGPEVKDLFERDIPYLTFPWKDTGTNCSTTLFDSGDKNIEQIVRFIDKTLETGDCVLVHSYYGVSRSCAVIIAYLMVKYGWTFENSESFVKMAHADMAIKPYFHRQLKTFARRHAVQVDIFDSRVDDSAFALDNQQLMLRNTYVNGLTADVQARNEIQIASDGLLKLGEPQFKPSSKKKRRIVFCDTRQGTGIASSATAPVLANRFVDPLSGTRTPPHPGSSLVEPSSAILARRLSPNSRRLESPRDVNPEGRVVLILKEEARPAAQAPVPHPASVSAPSSVGGGPSDHSATGGGATTGYSGSGQSINLRGPATGVSAAGGGAPPPPRTLGQLYGSQQTVTAIPSGQSTVQPLSGSPMSSYGGGGAATAASSPPPAAVRGGTKVASAFASLSSQSNVRRGSPLPMQRTSGGTSSASSGAQPPASSRYTALTSSPSGAASLLPASAAVGRGLATPPPRAASPMSQSPYVHPSVQAAQDSQSSARGSAPQPRTSSPLARPSNVTSFAPQQQPISPVHTLQAPGRTTGYTPASYGLTAVPYGGSGVTPMSAARPTAAPPVSTTTYPAYQGVGAVQRTSSPQPQTRVSAMAPSAAATARGPNGTPQRTSSPMGLRASPVASSQPAAAGRPANSPRSLAETYLGARGGPPASSTSAMRDTNSSALRRPGFR